MSLSLSKNTRRSLVICPDLYWVNLVLANLVSGNLAEPADLLVVNGQETPEMRMLCDAHNLRIVPWSLAKKTHYEVLHLLPAHCLLARTGRVIEELNQPAEIVLHGDSFRNGVTASPQIERLVTRVNHYGFRLVEEANLITGISPSIFHDSAITTFSSVREAWRRTQMVANEVFPSMHFSAGDLLFCDRYWGEGHYQARVSPEKLSAFGRELQTIFERYSRLVFRRHPWSKSDLWRNLVVQVTDSVGLEFVDWSDLYPKERSSLSTFNPEAQFFLGNLENLGGLFAFDSSLPLVAAASGSNAKFFYPSFEVLANFFSREPLNKLVQEQISWIQPAAVAISKLQENELGPFTFHTLGHGYARVTMNAFLEDALGAVYASTSISNWTSGILEH